MGEKFSSGSTVAESKNSLLKKNLQMATKQGNTFEAETREPTAWRVYKQRQHGKGEQITIYRYLLEPCIESNTKQSHQCSM